MVKKCISYSIGFLEKMRFSKKVFLVNSVFMTMSPPGSGGVQHSHDRELKVNMFNLVWQIKKYSFEKNKVDYMLLWVTTGYYSLLQVTTGYYRLLQVTTGHCRLLQLTTGYYRLLQVTIGYYRLLQHTTGYYMLLQVITGYYSLL